MTFSYDNFTRKSIPINPKITRVRKDVEWKEILAEFDERNERSSSQAQLSGKRPIITLIRYLTFLIDSSRKLLKWTTMPQGYWRQDDGKNLRVILEKFAKKRNFDPLEPESWYNISYNEVMGDMACTRKMLW